MTPRSLTKILVANRGEIACRIIAACRKDGIGSVAVYSDADHSAPHARLADEAINIGPGAPLQSYLNIEAIVEAAIKTGADAIHPGYGFLSENAEFAQAVGESGLIFIGPSPEAIQSMGNKGVAKRLMLDAGVPCVPGHDEGEGSLEELEEAAASVGFPLMVKAKAGGGGRGMRRVDSSTALRAALESAQSEALNAFGNGDLLLERVITNARHVEFQIVGDQLGHVVHLGERDCSLQRRHQKLIEEAPAPNVDKALRAKMGEAACAAARAIGYVGVGTVEFMLDDRQDFYFLEMNTRLQVEHPVTELVTGIDLVLLQFEIARGMPLPFEQADIALQGHAIEGRLCAEDPQNDFLPQSGQIALWAAPEASWLRTDTGVETGSEIGTFYDPMLAKIIVHGADREQARRRLDWALENLSVCGLKTNRLFLQQLLRSERFANGTATTDYLQDIVETLTGKVGPSPIELAMLACAIWSERCKANAATGPTIRHGRKPGTRFRILLADEQFECRVLEAEGTWQVSCGERLLSIGVANVEAASARICIDGVWSNIRHCQTPIGLHLAWKGAEAVAIDQTYAVEGESALDAEGVLAAPMTGRILELAVATGDLVQEGQVLLVLEAMKMEHRIVAPFDGRVQKVFIAEDDTVSAKSRMIEIVPDGELEG
ncbi:biotin carboxylase N-terminal domain-containing protein [Erythrobacter sp. AP23]|uniref:acetyl/propionyl/methylcrotonyl-CoA carboxylase subunit alpha n=1 Tax=Erythrobacter sp. AP23 TaxID=499656 RepID=UPI00076D0395|nr:biotin carboxylase N-terminal domain-containing protein [Erythrobacter sp. AP23]KWV93790.1 hypothetical protein ASS64_12915 [Erythrobacter sp. AP23]